MKINLILIAFLFSFNGISQNTKEAPVLLKTEQTVYTTGDTLKLTFSFDTLEVIHSNCNEPIFMVKNLKHIESRGIEPVAICRIVEFYFSTQGTIEIVLTEPGSYYLISYVKNRYEDFVSSETWNTIRSNTFEVVKK